MKSKIFEAKKDKLFSVIFYGLFAILLLLVMFIINQESTNQKWFSFFIVVFVFLMLIWIWYVTDYKIVNTILSVRSGPFNKNIPIRTITRIEIGKTQWIGFKLGLSRGGLIIHYNKYDQVYITPENQDKFCKQLKLVNKNIAIAKN